VFPNCSQSCGNPRKTRLSSAPIVPSDASGKTWIVVGDIARRDGGHGGSGFHALGIVPIVPNDFTHPGGIKAISKNLGSKRWEFNRESNRGPAPSVE
jgi:hypothetical protein